MIRGSREFNKDFNKEFNRDLSRELSREFSRVHKQWPLLMLMTAKQLITKGGWQIMTDEALITLSTSNEMPAGGHKAE